MSSASGSYDVAVQSVNDLGMSKWRNTKVSAWLTASSVAATTATLNLAGHSGNWYVKQTAPTPAGDCSSAISGTTHDLSNIASGTTQTFTAYGDSSCANALAEAAFTTPLAPTLTVSAVTDTTATLTIANHSGNWYYKATTGPDTTCSSNAVSTGSVNLTGLTAGDSYTYSAYSDSTCTTANKLATASAFTTSNVSVSNLGEALNSNCIVGRYQGTGITRCGMGFATGSATNGYTLDSVTVKIFVVGGNPSGLTVALHTESGNQPSNDTVDNTTFTEIDPTTGGDYTVECSGAGCQLSASTTYYVALSVPDAAPGDYYLWRTTGATNETRTPSNNGWSIANDYRSSGLNSWGSGVTTGALMFKVAATVNSD